MEFSAEQIAQILNGKIEGDGTVKLSGVSKIDDGKPGTLTFLSNPNYTNYIYSTLASAVLVNNDFIPDRPIKSTLIKVDNAYKALATLLEMYVQSKPQKVGKESPCFISDSSKIGELHYIGAFAYIGDNVNIGDNVKIYPHVYIGDNVEIKDNTILYPGVKIYENCKIGSNCILHAGVVIGSDGFGHAPQADGTYKKIHQIGNVIIEDDVEIGANTTIDCATMGSTIIHKGVKIDNLVQIAHNVEVGENTVMASQVGIAGSTKIGHNCILGGQVGIIGHINIGNRVIASAQSGVTKNFKDGITIMGTPAFDASQCRKSRVIYQRLPDMRQQILELEKQLKELKSKI